MLEKIREGSQGIVAKTILGVVVLTFALAGVGSYLGGTSTQPAAVVNGEEISQSDFEQKYQSNRARMEQQFGQMFAQLAADDAYMKTFKAGVLDQLISDELQNQLANNIGLRISADKIKETIRKMPEFQVDGKFDNEQYLTLLRRAGYQTSSFRDYLQVDSVRRQISQAIASTDFSLATEVKTQTELDKQTRDLEYIVFKQADYKDKVTLSDADKSSYYQANLDNFKTDEQVSLQYVELKMSALMDAIAVSDGQLESYYQDNISNYRTAVSRRRASHILIEFGSDEAAAKVKAQALLGRIKAGEDFAEVAKANSADTFSAEKGGDLDWFERGVLGDAFDNAAFGLAAVNDVSEVVRGDSGFHIIKLTGDEPEAIKPFAQVKEEVAQAFKRNQALDDFTDKHQKLSQLGFEMPDTLENAAEAIGVKVQETAFFSRFSPPAAVNFPKVVEAAFSSAVLTDMVNSEIIEISEDHMMMVRLLKHMPSRVKTEEEVAEQITTALTNEKAQALAEEAAKTLLAKLDGSSKLAVDPNSKDLTIVAKVAMERFTSDVDSTVRTEVFKLAHPEQGKVTTAVIKMTNGDQALVALSGVTTGKLPEDAKAIEQRIASQQSQRAYKDFIGALKEGASISKPGAVAKAQ